LIEARAGELSRAAFLLERVLIDEEKHRCGSWLELFPTIAINRRRTLELPHY
jgi:hypothetical protein